MNTEKTQTTSHPQYGGASSRLLTGTSFLKLTAVGLVMVVVLAAVVVVVAVVTRVLACPGWGALGACDWAWACASARLPGVVMEPCIFTGGSRDCWPYSIYCTHRIWTSTGRRTYSSRKYHPQPSHSKWLHCAEKLHSKQQQITINTRNLFTSCKWWGNWRKWAMDAKC